MVVLLTFKGNYPTKQITRPAAPPGRADPPPWGGAFAPPLGPALPS